MLSVLLNRESYASVRNGVLLYKQLIRPMMDYAWPVWRPAVRIHVRSLQVLQSKCHDLATGAPCFVSSLQIHENMGFRIFSYLVRALTERFDLRLADVGNP